MKMKKLLLSVVSFAMMVTVINVVQKEANDNLNDKISNEVIEGNTSVNLSDKSIMTGEDVVVDLLNNKQENDKQNHNYNANQNTNDFVNEKGEYQIPFDEAYPEIFEEGDIAYSKETLMVKFKKSFDGTISKALKDTGIVKVEKMFDVEDASWYTCYINEKDDIKKTMASVRELSNVVVAEYNFAYETAVTEVDDWDKELSGNKELNKQWYRKFCQIEKAWQHGKNEVAKPGGSEGVIVAVIDTGVDYTHKDLAANIWKNTLEIPNNMIDDDGNGYIDDYYGVDMTQQDPYTYNPGFGSGMDDHGHGTHVAGIIGAVNNNEGIVGIAYNTKIMPIKAGDSTGYFLHSNVANAILYAFKNGADVINMSFGGTVPSIAVQDALALAYNRCVLVASAGNDGAQNEGLNPYAPVIPNYPAALSYVIGVMSVGDDNMESSFTNFDAFGFNSVEYEVYAPGEQIISTIPGDRYAKMSGTSMAAPIVAAQAALLRSYYTDRNTYPTKFIYGQIVGTAEDVVQCSNSKGHLDHNIPGLVNFYDSLTVLPKPDVVFSDYTIFDTEGFAQDVDGVNNGDGVIDSGETFALGFTLRNRWGMSKDTIVSVSAENDNGVTCPYVTVLNDHLDYGSIGTYSESDSGKIYTEDTWTGWENPFYIHISDECPNDYSITLNINVSYKNALDANDKTDYSNDTKVLIKVRNGEIVPYYIEEDTVLTKDNYYIIPTAVTIAKGATLRIEPGTKVQFWTNDPEDAYAENAIVNIHVYGNLICEGTAEEPVELFPSGWFSNYAVMITRDYEGTVNLKHTIITNGDIGANLVENCEFKQNYRNYLTYRYYSGSKVYETTTHGGVSADNIIGTAFYKLGGKYSAYGVRSNQLIDQCIFVDCNASIDALEMTNNVFYGNNSLDGTEEGKNSTIGTLISNNTLKVEQFFTLNSTGNTYLTFRYDSNTILERFMPLFDGEWFSLNSKEEFNELLGKVIWYDGGGQFYYGYETQIKQDQETGAYVNDNGTLVPADIRIGLNTDQPIHLACIKDSPFFFTGSTYSFEENYETFYIDEIRKLLEIPTFYPINITLEEYVTNLTVDKTYQLHPTTWPNNKEYPLIYTSENEEVATVDENGLITAVAAGTTNIRVYSEDLGSYNYLTVNVTDEVALERIDVDVETLYLKLNETQKLTSYFYPSNTTQRSLTYTSEDDSIVSINEYGYMKALKEGSTTITIQGENEISTTMKVIVSEPATVMYFDEEIYYTNLDKGEYLIPTTDIDVSLLEWESSHPEVAYVDETGELIKLSEGNTTIRVKDRNSDMYADIQLVLDKHIVSHFDIKKLQMSDYSGGERLMLTEDGNVYRWNKNHPFAMQILLDNGKYLSNIKDIALTGDGFFAINNDDEIYYYSLANSDTVSEQHFVLANAAYFADYYGRTTAMMVVTYNGDLYQLNSGGSYYTDIQKVDYSSLGDTILDVAQNDRHYYVLTDSHLLYRSQFDSNNFELINADVNDIYAFGYGWNISADKDDVMLSYRDDSTYEIEKQYENGRVDGNGYQWYIHEGKVITDNSNDAEKLSSLSNVTDIFNYYSGTFIETEDHKVYVYGQNESASLPVGNSNSQYQPKRIYLNVVEVEDELNMVGNNTIVSNEEYDYPALRDSGNYEVESKELSGYQAISTKEDLMNISKNLDGKYYLTNDIKFTSEDFNASNSYGWSPIGTFKNNDGTYYQEAFTGVLDGNGYSIIGLTEASLNLESIGLFAINQGTIANLKVVDFMFYANGNKENYVGAIAGKMEGANAKIVNCYSEGFINDTYRNGEIQCYYGGIVGYSNGGTISYCETSMYEVYIDNKVESYAGGIVGYANNTVISNCINESSINACRYGGGIAGYVTGNDSVIEECINKGSISITGNINKPEESYNLGGITGELNAGTIRNCYNECDMGYASGVAVDYNIGGIAGVVNGTIENCYNAKSMHYVGKPNVRKDQVNVEYYSMSNKTFALSSFQWEEGKVYEPISHVPTRDGYEFLGWYNMSTGQKFNGIFEPNCKYSFVARWKATGQTEIGQDAINYMGETYYPLTINLNGSNYISQDYGESLGYFDTYKYALDGWTDYTGENPRLWFNENNTKEGISFNIHLPSHKYITSIECNGAPIQYTDTSFAIYPNFECGLVIDVTLRDRNYNEVTIKGTMENDGVVSVQNETTMTTINPGVKDGFKFVGWLDQDGNKFEFNQAITRDMTIHAKWLSNTVTIGDVAGTINSGAVVKNSYAIDSIDGAIGKNNNGTISDVKELSKLEATFGSSYKDYDFINIWDLTYLVGNELIITYDDAIQKGLTFNSITFTDGLDNHKIEVETSLGLNTLHIKAKEALIEGRTYIVGLPTAVVQNEQGSYLPRSEVSFIYRKEPVREIIHDLVIDEEIVENRDTVTQAEFEAFWKNFVKDGLNSRFYANAILNRTGNNDEVEQWLRIMAPNSNGYTSISYGGNYWGTLDEQLINLQIVDFEDMSGLADINHGVINEIPEDTYPFVVNAYLEVDSKQVDTVGNQKVTFVVEFNRDMDTSIDLDVKFGSSYPYADYKVNGEYVDARTWKGEMQLTTIIENGYQYWSVTNGQAAGTSYKLYTDWGRFPFIIDTTGAQALTMQAESTSEGIHLTWEQDDFETLAGYNVYRATVDEDGYYTKINRTLIPADTKEWLDTNVYPGQKYYYNFTVIKTDLTESEPSGKISATALDTMAPNIYHSPVYETFTGSNLIIKAFVTDNISITNAKVYYRVTGTEEYQYAEMYAINDEYTAVIPSDLITTDGLEYYIEATDGVSFAYKGDSENPYQVTVKVAVADNQKGDVDGNGSITLQDAMKLLYAINDRYNMTLEEFARADLDGNGKLEAYEALIIIQYANGTITSIPVGGNNG